MAKIATDLYKEKDEFRKKIRFCIEFLVEKIMDARKCISISLPDCGKVVYFDDERQIINVRKDGNFSISKQGVSNSGEWVAFECLDTDIAIFLIGELEEILVENPAEVKQDNPEAVR